jgi:N-acetylglucosaminyldiphosphoundecaprenol N-acetyl-beta-D-mannosaminyltransferase
MLEIFRSSVQKGYRHFLYGGDECGATRLAEKLTERFPGLQIVDTHTPPFRALTEDEDRAVVEEINASRADVVWIVLGTPKQERWMAAHVGRLNAPVLIGIGAAFHFLSGAEPQAPRWMQRSGLEWLFRLATEPRYYMRRIGASASMGIQ